MKMLGPVLGSLYPGGGSWLIGRLRDVADKRARCTLALVENKLVGVLIETPKAGKRVKISTLYVAESERGRGIAGKLLDSAINDLARKDVETAYITAAHTVSPEINRVLQARKFNWKGRALDRYGKGRHEDVFELEFTESGQRGA